MKRILLFISFFLVTILSTATSLKTIYIETVNKEEPTCDFLEAPEGCMGSTCANAVKVPCRIIIMQENDTLYDSGEYKKSVSGATIKINGNTTAYYSTGENYPYKIKLQKKADLLCRDNESFADKDWRLLKDAITLNTIIGYKISELLGFAWTPSYTPCNVYLNGDYRGCYLLIESVKRNDYCRLNVDKNTGYIIERDPYWWNETTYFSTNYFSPYLGYRWTWKYPDEEDVSSEQEDYIRQYVNDTEQSIYNGTYDKYINVESFARWVLAHDILGTKDSGGSNLYVLKYDNTNNTLLEMPCLWDFDSNYSMEAGQFSKIHTAPYDFYFNDLFNNGNKTFLITYKRLWNSVKTTLLRDITDYITDYINSDEGLALQQSRNMYIQRWDHWRKITMEEDAQEAINWFQNHLVLLDNAITQLDETNNLKSINCQQQNTNSFYYGISGIRYSNPKRQLYIKDRKIYFKKN